jgi:hypothetical protein
MYEILETEKRIQCGSPIAYLVFKLCLDENNGDIFLHPKIQEQPELLDKYKRGSPIKAQALRGIFALLSFYKSGKDVDGGAGTNFQFERDEVNNVVKIRGDIREIILALVDSELISEQTDTKLVAKIVESYVKKITTELSPNLYKQAVALIQQDIAGLDSRKPLADKKRIG